MRRCLAWALLAALAGGPIGCDDKKTTAPAAGTGKGTMIGGAGAPPPPPPPKVGG